MESSPHLQWVLPRVGNNVVRLLTRESHKRRMHLLQNDVWCVLCDVCVCWCKARNWSPWLGRWRGDLERTLNIFSKFATSLSAVKHILFAVIATLNLQEFGQFVHSMMIVVKRNPR